MTDDVNFAKGLFTSALRGFGQPSKAEVPSEDDSNSPAGDVSAKTRADEIIPEKRSGNRSRRPEVSSIERRRKAEKSAANAGRKGSRPKKLATIGMRCTTKQKMILLALMDHLEIDKQSDAAVEAILIVAAEYEIKGAEDELTAVQAERLGDQ
jgi:hypothetical protein